MPREVELLPAATPATPDIICWLHAAVPPNRNGRIDVTRAAKALKVSETTIRRWIRQAGERDFNTEARKILARYAILRGHGDYLWPPLDPITTQRRALLAQAATQALHAVEADPDAYLDDPKATTPTEVYLYHHPKARVYGIALGTSRTTRTRLLGDGADILQTITLPNTYAAQVLKYDTLHTTHARACITPRAFLTAGRTETWIQRGGNIYLHRVRAETAVARTVPPDPPRVTR